MIFQNVSSRIVGDNSFLKYWQLYYPEMLAIIFVRNDGDKWQQSFVFVFENCGNVNKYSFQKCQQLYFLTILTCPISEMLAIIVSRNVGNSSSPKYWTLAILISEMLENIFLEMLATNVSNWIVRECPRMLNNRLLKG